MQVDHKSLFPQQSKLQIRWLVSEYEYVQIIIFLFMYWKYDEASVNL